MNFYEKDCQRKREVFDSALKEIPLCWKCSLAKSEEIDKGLVPRRITGCMGSDKITSDYNTARKHCPIIRHELPR